MQKLISLFYYYLQEKLLNFNAGHIGQPYI